VAPLIPVPGLPVRLVEERDNPTSAYYLLPALAACGARVTRHGLDDPPSPRDLAGNLVVVNRYLSEPWRRALATARPRLAGLAYFMDDDLFDPAASRGLPWRYRWKLWRRATRYRSWLAGVGSALWVSTPALAAKYAAWSPRLVAPAALAEADDRTAGPAGLVFYHGSAAHRAEIAWLRPVLAAVLGSAPGLEFEIMGGRDVARLYRGLPRVSVVHPMAWASYRLFCARPGRLVGLAPQLPGAFNAGRSHTKFFDITRAGAVGVYAAGTACAAVVEHGLSGLVVPMEPAAWAEAIVSLAGDPARREAMLARARDTAARLSREARAGWTRG
jgi:hypothetical protein